MKIFMIIATVLVAVLAQEEPALPAGCTVWYDGCHTCQVVNGHIESCTEEACFRMDDPKCITFESEQIDCNTVQVCAKIYQPVCATNGVTYGNKCEFDQAKCDGHLDDADFRVAHEGRCSETIPRVNGIPNKNCNRMCTRDYRPVCGSDGKTYSNRCKFEIARCKSPSVMTIVSPGECPKAADCNKMCPAVWQPVCGSDFVTYGNSCELSNANCGSATPIRTLYKGECVQKEPEEKPQMGIPSGCTVYSPDGCNRCSVVAGRVARCTKMACPPGMRKQPRCIQFAN